MFHRDNRDFFAGMGAGLGTGFAGMSAAAVITPHPTLIGENDPQVQMAGLLKIGGGKILSYDNNSGHYKPNAKSMSVADEAFSKLPPSLFSKKFKRRNK